MKLIRTKIFISPNSSLFPQKFVYWPYTCQMFKKIGIWAWKSKTKTERARNLGHYLRSVPQLTPINTTKCTFSELVIVIKIVCSSMQFLQRKYPPCWLLLTLFFPACLSTHKLAKLARGQWDWSSRSVGPYTNSSKIIAKQKSSIFNLHIHFNL